MLSQQQQLDAGFPEHLRQKLSIDERVAAQQEAKKSVLNHKLFTEEPTMISHHQCEISQDVSGASFPQFIL